MKVLIIFLFSNFLFAHDNWVKVDNFKVNVGERVVVRIGGGHSFLVSDKRVPRKLIHRLEVISPSGERDDLNPIADKNEWKAAFVPNKKGVYIISMEFRRPGMEESLLFGKSVVDVGSHSKKTRFLNSDLEIAFSDEDRNGVIVLSKGRQISSRVAINSKRGISYLRIGKKGAGKLDLKKGVYMLTTFKRGQQSSLTFEVY